MNAKLNRSKFIKLCLFVGYSFAAARSGISAETNMKDHYENLESLKKGIPLASRWWNINFREKLFVVCLESPLSYGQSRQNIYAWRRDANGSFTLVWFYRPTGIGRVEVEIDERKGIISVKAKAYTEWKDTVIAFAHLGATVG